jgi:glucuronate isomerase
MRANGVDERLCTGDAPARESSTPGWPRSRTPCATRSTTGRTSSSAVLWDRLPDRPGKRRLDLGGPTNGCRPCACMTSWRRTASPSSARPTTRPIPWTPMRGSGSRPETRVYPAFRPDKALGVANPAAFNPWVERLAGAARARILSFDDFMGALKTRHDDFHAFGGRLSDHGLEPRWRSHAPMRRPRRSSRPRGRAAGRPRTRRRNSGPA